MSNQHNPINRNTLIATGIPNAENEVVYVAASLLYDAFLDWMIDDLCKSGQVIMEEQLNEIVNKKKLMDRDEEMMLDLLQAIKDSGGQPAVLDFKSNLVEIGGKTFPSNENYTSEDLRSWRYVVSLLYSRDLVYRLEHDNGYLYAISALGYDYLDEHSKQKEYNIESDAKA